MHYQRKHGFHFGRRWAVGCSLQVITREAHAAACAGALVMLDIVNCVPTLMTMWSPSGCALHQYVQHRSRFYDAVAGLYNVSLDAAKQLFLSICFGGGVAAWRTNWNVLPDVVD